MTLKTAYEWCDLLGIHMYDPDGWYKDGKPLTDLIDKAEFNLRICTSTIGFTADP